MRAGSSKIAARLLDSAGASSKLHLPDIFLSKFLTSPLSTFMLPYFNKYCRRGFVHRDDRTEIEHGAYSYSQANQHSTSTGVNIVTATTCPNVH